MKKVCVSTYCEWSSYGSVLQAMGLKKSLYDLGFDSFIVRDTPAPVSNKTFPFVLSKNPKNNIKQLLSLKINKKHENLYQKSVDFINKNLDVTYYNDFRALSKQIPVADYYIAGSDQIWHPQLCKPAFFLDFLPVAAKRISYATSMGVSDIPQGKESVFADLISKFDNISVREEDMEQLLSAYTDKPILRHIDPTFLVNADFWRSFETEYTYKKPYILVYAIYWDKKFNNELKKLRKKSGCDIVVLCPSKNSYGIWGNDKIFDASPAEFLYLIDHAEAIISSSFHGVALSLNFNKKFVPVINPASPSRLTSLLNILNIEAADIENVLSFDLASYKEINAKIELEKQKAIQYLKEVLV